MHRGSPPHHSSLRAPTRPTILILRPAFLLTKGRMKVMTARRKPEGRTRMIHCTFLRNGLQGDGASGGEWTTGAQAGRREEWRTCRFEMLLPCWQKGPISQPNNAQHHPWPTSHGKVSSSSRAAAGKKAINAPLPAPAKPACRPPATHLTWAGCGRRP
jgi:hypothetical protein